MNIYAHKPLEIHIQQTNIETRPFKSVMEKKIKTILYNSNKHETRSPVASDTGGKYYRFCEIFSEIT